MTTTVRRTLLAAATSVGDVHLERRVAADVLADLGVVDTDDRAVRRGVEPQHDPLVLPARGHADARLVPGVADVVAYLGVGEEVVVARGHGHLAVPGRGAATSPRRARRPPRRGRTATARRATCARGWRCPWVAACRSSCARSGCLADAVRCRSWPMCGSAPWMLARERTRCLLSSRRCSGARSRRPTRWPGWASCRSATSGSPASTRTASCARARRRPCWPRARRPRRWRRSSRALLDAGAGSVLVTRADEAARAARAARSRRTPTRTSAPGWPGSSASHPSRAGWSPSSRAAPPTARRCARPRSGRAPGDGGAVHEDVGVAGLHRLAPALEDLRRADCVVVVAGPGRGALLGRGRPRGGAGDRRAHLARLRHRLRRDHPAASMLSSCAAGVAVVGIDDGFGAGTIAARIARAAGGAR